MGVWDFAGLNLFRRGSPLHPLHERRRLPVMLLDRSPSRLTVPRDERPHVRSEGDVAIDLCAAWTGFGAGAWACAASV